MQKSLNAIDRDIIEGRLAAERKLPKQYDLPWSPQLWKAKKLVKYRELCLSQSLTMKDLHAARSKVAKAAKIDFHEELPSRAFIRSEKKKAIKALVSVIKSVKSS